MHKSGVFYDIVLTQIMTLTLIKTSFNEKSHDPYPQIMINWHEPSIHTGSSEKPEDPTARRYDLRQQFTEATTRATPTTAASFINSI
jgi:hypothetical protein